MWYIPYVVHMETRLPSHPFDENFVYTPFRGLLTAYGTPMDYERRISYCVINTTEETKK